MSPENIWAEPPESSSELDDLRSEYGRVRRALEDSEIRFAIQTAECLLLSKRLRSKRVARRALDRFLEK